MSSVVSLSKARKARAREKGEATAAANRLRFGRAKSERAAQRLEAERLGRTVDQARRDD